MIKKLLQVLKIRKKRGRKKMIRRILELLKIRQKDEKELADYKARQETYKQIQEARKYLI